MSLSILRTIQTGSNYRVFEDENESLQGEGKEDSEIKVKVNAHRTLEDFRERLYWPQPGPRRKTNIQQTNVNTPNRSFGFGCVLCNGPLIFRYPLFCSLPNLNILYLTG